MRCIDSAGQDTALCLPRKRRQPLLLTRAAPGNDGQRYGHGSGKLQGPWRHIAAALPRKMSGRVSNTGVAYVDSILRPLISPSPQIGRHTHLQRRASVTRIDRLALIATGSNRRTREDGPGVGAPARVEPIAVPFPGRHRLHLYDRPQRSPLYALGKPSDQSRTASVTGWSGSSRRTAQRSSHRGWCARAVRAGTKTGPATRPPHCRARQG